VTAVYKQHETITQDVLILACNVLLTKLKESIEFYDDDTNNSNSLANIICKKDYKVFNIMVKLFKLVVMILEKLFQLLENMKNAFGVQCANKNNDNYQNQKITSNYCS